MASAADILSALQNGVVAASNLTKILRAASANSSSLRVTIASTIFSQSSAVIVSVTKQTFTTAGAFTYTPTTNMAYCIAEGVGGGGGGGGSSQSAANVVVGCGGAGGGGYARAYLTAASIGAASTGSVGTGGAGGASGANNGSPGTATTLGSLLSAGGGSGSVGINAGTTPVGAAGGISTSGDVLIQGGAGGYGALAGVATANIFVPSGYGGNSYFGSGGQGFCPAVGGTGRGSSGYKYGGGGSGGIVMNAGAGTGSSGSPGADGILIITEFLHG